MAMRKQLGILATFVLLVHMFLSFMITTPFYYPKYFEKVTVQLAIPAGAQVTQFGTISNEAAVLETSSNFSTASHEEMMAANMTFAMAHVLNPGSGFVWNINLSWFFGIMAAVLLFLPSKLKTFLLLKKFWRWLSGVSELTFFYINSLFAAVSSMPAIATSLSWREWVVLQSWFGNVALMLASAHTLNLVCITCKITFLVFLYLSKP